jgi:3-deoxy-D-manno-octulosonate 8-phosphate phosphatase (KDO 8-P phosphatase)
MTIKAVVMDVDGVLTDGTVWLDQGRRETKRISFRDIMGVSIGRRAGLIFALVSGEDGPSLHHVAAKLEVTEVYGGCKDKADALRNFAARHDLDLSEVCFIGDDINDVPALAICGLAVVPADAHAAAAAEAAVMTDHPGGSGAVRELIDSLVTERPYEPHPEPPEAPAGSGNRHSAPPG